MLAQPLRNLVEPVVIGPRVGVPDETGNPPVEPAHQKVRLVAGQPVAPVPQVHEERIAPVRLALLLLLLLAARRLLVRVQRGAFGLVRAIALCLVGGVRVEPGLGARLGLVDHLDGGVDRACLRCPIVLQRPDRAFRCRDVPAQLLDGLLAPRQQCHHLALDVVDALNDQFTRQQVDAHARQIPVVLRLGLLLLGKPAIQSGDFLVQPADLPALLAERTVDRGQCLLSRDHPTAPTNSLWRRPWSASRTRERRGRVSCSRSGPSR